MPLPDINSADQTPDELKRAVRGGTRAVAAVQVASQLITLATLAVLLRLLTPGDYGLLAMVLPVLFFLRIFTTLGLNVATVQRPDLSPGEVSAMFWLNLLAGGATTLFTALAAPALAWFFRQDELTTLTVALSGTALVAAFGAQHQALLERKLQLGRLANCRLASQIVASAAAIAAALAGWGVWALVVQQYVDVLLNTALAWWIESWRPTAPSRAVSVRGHLRFGSYYAASSVMFFLAGNLDKVLIGRLLGDYALGLYSQAFALMLKPVYMVTTPLAGVMLSALSRAAGDRAAQELLLVSFYRVVGIALLPASVGLWLVGDRAMLVLGGTNWAEAGPIVSVLGLAVFAQGLINIAGPVFAAAGQTARLFGGSVVLTLVLAQAYVAGWWFGREAGAPVLGIAWGYTLAVLVVLLVPYSLYCLYASGYRAGPILRALRRPALAALGMGLIVYSGGRLLAQQTDLPIALQFTAEVALGLVSYTYLARQEVRWLLRQVARGAR